MSKDIERRFNRATLEARAGKSANRTIGGYGAVYNRLSDNLGGFVERVDPTFFNKSQVSGSGCAQRIAVHC
jgi:phage head maturation protease